MIIKKGYFILLFLTLFAYVSLLLKTPLYMDDNVRIVTGKPDWGIQGRPLADLVYYLLSFSFYKIKYLFPYSLYLGLICLLLIFNKFMHNFNKSKEVKLVYCYSFLLLIMNPFFMQNLSYKYDSLPMILGLLSSICSFLFLETKKSSLNIIISVCLLISSFSLYQPCSNAYLMLSFYSMVLLNFSNKKDYLKKIIGYLSIFVISFFIYNVVVLKILGYGTKRSSFIDINNINLIIEKLKYFFTGLIFQLPLSMQIILYIFILSSIYLMLLNSNNKKLCILSIIGIFLSLWGGLLLIKEMVDLPREFPVFGLYLLIMIIYIFNNIKTPPINTLFSILIFIFLILQFFYFYKYIEFYNIQKNYENNIELSIIKTVHEKKLLGKINISGKPDYSPIIKDKINKDIFIKKMLNTSDEWILRYELYRKGLPNVNLNFTSGNQILYLKLLSDKYPPICKTEYFIMYKYKSNIEVFIIRNNKLFY